MRFNSQWMWIYYFWNVQFQQIKQTEAWFSDYENQFSYWTFHKRGRFNVTVRDEDPPSSRWMCPAVFVSSSSIFVTSCLNLCCKNPWCFSSERRTLRQGDWADDHGRNISVGNSQKSRVFWRCFPEKNLLGILLTPHFHFNSFQSDFSQKVKIKH